MQVACLELQEAVLAGRHGVGLLLGNLKVEGHGCVLVDGTCVPRRRSHLAWPRVGDFCCMNFGDKKVRGTKTGEKIREKSGGPKRKIREKSVLPKSDPKEQDNATTSFRMEPLLEGLLRSLGGSKANFLEV